MLACVLRQVKEMVFCEVSYILEQNSYDVRGTRKIISKNSNLPTTFTSTSTLSTYFFQDREFVANSLIVIIGDCDNLYKV